MTTKRHEPSGVFRYKLTQPVDAFPGQPVGTVLRLSKRKARALGLKKANSEILR